MEFTKELRNEMELSKQQRHEAYKKCLIDIEIGLYGYCCASFVYNSHLSGDKIYFAKDVFPELYNLRENDVNVFWFKNNKQRIEALKKCIEQTKP